MLAMCASFKAARWFGSMVASLAVAWAVQRFHFQAAI
jgi:hypothetical protein